MGIGSKIKRAARKVDGTLAGVARNPTSTSSLQLAGTLFSGGLPIKYLSGTASSLLSKADGAQRQQVNQAIDTAKQDRAIKQGIRDLKAPSTLEGRQKIGVVAGYVGIVAVVVVVCVVSYSTMCGPAIGAGLTAATMLNSGVQNYQAERSAIRNARTASATAGGYSGYQQNQYPSGNGGAAGELFSGNLDGLFQSLDPTTKAGLKTILFLGGMVALTTTAYFGVKYLRK